MFVFAKVFTVLISIVVLSIDETGASCCGIAYISYHVCLGTPQEQDIRNHIVWDFPRDANILYWIRSEADIKRPKCISYFCADGSYTDKFRCGVGKCNIFGCGCKGGCRKSKGKGYQELGRIWREDHGLLMKSKHQLKGTFQ